MSHAHAQWLLLQCCDDQGVFWCDFAAFAVVTVHSRSQQDSAPLSTSDSVIVCTWLCTFAGEDAAKDAEKMATFQKNFRNRNRVFHTLFSPLILPEMADAIEDVLRTYTPQTLGDVSGQDAASTGERGIGPMANVSCGVLPCGRGSLHRQPF